jgi:hypothetical protein
MSLVEYEAQCMVMLKVEVSRERDRGSPVERDFSFPVIAFVRL